MRFLLIGNPNAGRGSARERIREFAVAVEARGHAIEVFLTARAGDGRTRAGGDLAGFDRVVVAGGDGTLNEVLNGLADPGACPLALLPCGTANILAHELGLPWDPVGLARVASEGRAMRIDLGLLTRPGQAARRFLLVASSGFDALVTRTIHQRRSGTLGYLGYVMPIASTLLSYRPPRLLVSLDGGEPRGSAFAIVAKAKNYGGLFTVADRARLDSGRFDVCLFARAHAGELVRAMVAGLTGGVSGLRGVDYLHATRVRIEAAADAAPVEVDGDDVGDTPVDLELRAGAVTVMAPAREG